MVDKYTQAYLEIVHIKVVFFKNIYIFEEFLTHHFTDTSHFGFEKAYPSKPQIHPTPTDIHCIKRFPSFIFFFFLS